MAGGKGKSTGGKAGPKETVVKTQKSHSAKAGLQVRVWSFVDPTFSCDQKEPVPQTCVSTVTAAITLLELTILLDGNESDFESPQSSSQNL